MGLARNLSKFKPNSDGLVEASDLATGAALPDQTGNAGKLLTTDGSSASWQPPPSRSGFTSVPLNSSNTSRQLTLSDGQTIALAPDNNGYSVVLPDATTMTAGDSFFTFFNQEPFGVALKDYTGVMRDVISAGVSKAQLIVANTSTQAGVSVLNLSPKTSIAVATTLQNTGVTMSGRNYQGVYSLGNGRYVLLYSITGTNTATLWGVAFTLNNTTKVATFGSETSLFTYSATSSEVSVTGFASNNDGTGLFGIAVGYNNSPSRNARGYILGISVSGTTISTTNTFLQEQSSSSYSDDGSSYNRWNGVTNVKINALGNGAYIVCQNNESQGAQGWYGWTSTANGANLNGPTARLVRYASNTITINSTVFTGNGGRTYYPNDGWYSNGVYLSFIRVSDTEILFTGTRSAFFTKTGRYATIDTSALTWTITNRTGTYASNECPGEVIASTQLYHYKNVTSSVGSNRVIWGGVPYSYSGSGATLATANGITVEQKGYLSGNYSQFITGDTYTSSPNTGSVYIENSSTQTLVIDDAGAVSEYNPSIALMRFNTSGGAGVYQFNGYTFKNSVAIDSGNFVSFHTKNTDSTLWCNWLTIGTPYKL